MLEPTSINQFSLSIYLATYIPKVISTCHNITSCRTSNPPLNSKLRVGGHLPCDYVRFNTELIIHSLGRGDIMSVFNSRSLSKKKCVGVCAACCCGSKLRLGGWNDLVTLSCPYVRMPCVVSVKASLTYRWLFICVCLFHAGSCWKIATYRCEMSLRSVLLFLTAGWAARPVWQHWVWAVRLPLFTADQLPRSTTAAAACSGFLHVLILIKSVATEWGGGLLFRCLEGVEYVRRYKHMSHYTWIHPSSANVRCCFCTQQDFTTFCKRCCFLPRSFLCHYLISNVAPAPSLLAKHVSLKAGLTPGSPTVTKAFKGCSGCLFQRQDKHLRASHALRGDQLSANDAEALETGLLLCWKLHVTTQWWNS